MKTANLNEQVTEQPEREAGSDESFREWWEKRRQAELEYVTEIIRDWKHYSTFVQRAENETLRELEREVCLPGACHKAVQEAVRNILAQEKKSLRVPEPQAFFQVKTDPVVNTVTVSKKIFCLLLMSLLGLELLVGILVYAGDFSHNRTTKTDKPTLMGEARGLAPRPSQAVAVPPPLPVVGPVPLEPLPLPALKKDAEAFPETAEQAEPVVPTPLQDNPSKDAHRSLQ